MQVLAHSPAEREKWNNLTQSGREDVLHHLEQELAYHIASNRQGRSTYRFDVNDLMFITRPKPASGNQFVFTDANSKAAVHHWTLKHSWWWANQPYSVQQELEERLLEFSEVTLEVLENHLCQRARIAAAKKMALCA